MHILNNKHEYGPIQSTMTLIKNLQKRMAYKHFRKLLYTTIFSKWNNDQGTATRGGKHLILDHKTHYTTHACA
jgi:hypothetical protein